MRFDLHCFTSATPCNTLSCSYFGVVKHPGSGSTLLSPMAGGDVEGSGSHTHGVSDAKSSRSSKKDSTAQELLASKGFIPIRWCGRYEADKVSIGTHDVLAGQGGMYGLVFDNTLSKQTSKTATFVVLTYPIDMPPQTANHLPNLQLPNAERSEGSLGKYGSTRLEGTGVASSSVDSLPSHHADGGKSTSASHRDGTRSPTRHTGNLSKRRRKKGQGYARRFFSLDFSTCTLSYYYNRNSSALRGAIPLSLAAVAADERRREISIDSGAEIWHLRAPNTKEFEEWSRALERASRIARGVDAPEKPTSLPLLRLDVRNALRVPSQPNQQEEAEWAQVETLVSQVVGIRDALRRLTKEVTAIPKTSTSGHFLTPGSVNSAEESGDNYFPPVPEKRPHFWNRKSSASPLTPSSLQHAMAAAAPTPGSPIKQQGTNGIKVAKRHSKRPSREERSLPDHCHALLTDLDSVVAEFTGVINNSKRRRLPIPVSAGAMSRKSMETVSTADEFFDVEDANSGIVKFDGSEYETHGADDTSFHDSSSVSSVEDDGAAPTADGLDSLFPSKAKSLVPLPLEERVHRRTTVPPATVMPPSLIAFVRKNVGKDLSTISMPVSANEPISLLQKVAEQLEYAQLLDRASQQKAPTDRLLYVTAFAISQFSGGRTKERAIRKPFNPLLGETFELVRTDKEVPGGFRLLVEKVHHRPVKLAIHAESANWSFCQTPAPGQKFWGKSAEITTDGRVRISLHLPNGGQECYSWNIATMFLRNVVMGEKYVEPVGTMTVVNDSTGHKASIEFRSKGMFGGRAEEVQADLIGPDGRSAGSGLTGTWTAGLRVNGQGKSSGDEIWRVGDLVDNAAQTYGMTLFAAGLNEITAVEKGKLAPTDSRLRPDQRLAELGKLDEAEAWKHKLEEEQRARRRVLEARGVTHQPRWFARVDEAPEGEEVWRIKAGKDSYWEARAKGSWAGVEDIFAIPGE